ncbi:MAG: hypothetical protein KDA79_02690 [Planctomycetaceae bacterium]|nr:hypothetical protein [Planctomycetaceae bacterium]
MRRSDPVAGRGEILSFRSGSTSWQADSSLVTELFDRDGLRIARWLQNGQAEIVKDGPHRTVYRLSLPSGAYYLKHFRVADWKARLQNVVRPCRAALEWNAAVQVGLAGINTIEPLAIGVNRQLGLATDSYLLTRSIAGTETLHDFILQDCGGLSRKARIRVRHRIAAELGRMIGRMHRAGLIHHDLHAGNILLQIDPGQFVRLWLIDLHAVVPKRHIPERQLHWNLSLLSHFFHNRATPAERARFFSGYWSVLTSRTGTASRTWKTAAPLQRKPFARAAESCCQRLSIDAFDKGDRKWSRGNRRLLIRRAAGCEIRGLASLGEPLLLALCRNPHSLLEHAGSSLSGREVSHENEQLTRHENLDREDASSPFVARLEAEGLPLHGVVQSWNEPSPSFWSKLTSRQHLSSARRAWENGHALLRRGFATPRPLLCISQQSTGPAPASGAESGTDAGDCSNRQSWLMTEIPPETDSLTEAVRATGGISPGTDSGRKSALLRAVARTIRSLHDHGFDAAPGGSLASHLRIVRGSVAAPVLITRTEGLTSAAPLGSRQQRRSLVAVAWEIGLSQVSLSDRLRFLRCWLGTTDHTVVRSWWMELSRQLKQWSSESRR